MKRYLTSKSYQARRLRRNSTNEENILWNELKQKRFKYRFRRQHVIEPYIVDFYCSALQLAIEIDGEQHSYEENQLYDLQRTRYFESQGITVLRFWNSEIRNELRKVLEIIYWFVEER